MHCREDVCVTVHGRFVRGKLELNISQNSLEKLDQEQLTMSQNYDKSQLESLLDDRELMEEVRGQFAESEIPSVSAERAAVRRELGTRDDRVREMAYQEAIILAFGRPSILVKDNSFEEPKSTTWKTRLRPVRLKLETVIPRVGRVELFHHEDYEWVGTAWVIDERTLVTNRHVADIFARKNHAGVISFRSNSSGQQIEASMDFREEHNVRKEEVVGIERVTFIADSTAPDVAFMRVSRNDADTLPDPIPLADESAEKDQLIGVIGYPAWDGRRNDIMEMQRIFGGVFNVKRLAPGYVTGSGNGRLTHDCSTLGGNSGSPIINCETGEAIGLHYSGRFHVANRGVDVSVVKNLLRRTQASVNSGGFAAEDDDVEEARTVDFYDGREGYREDFFGDSHKLFVPLPKLTAAQQSDAAKIEGQRRESSYILDYTHFSCVINGKRKLPFFTAVNIDGASLFSPRRRRTRWQIDPRIPRDEQAGNELYRHNKLDRGHMVRRLDPVWGPRDEAMQAEEDTFHYSNAAPQHERLNQRDWVGLEEYLLDALGDENLKASVFTGPLFSECDREYRGVQIPEAFWKVVALLAEDDNVRVTAYLLGQANFLPDIEFAFGDYKTYQTSVAKIEELTDLDFGDLKQLDPRDGTESISEFELMDDPAAALGI